MNFSSLTERDRGILAACRGKQCHCVNPFTEKLCRDLASRGLLRPIRETTYLIQSGRALESSTRTAYRTTPAGQRVLNDQLAHPATPKQIANRKWAQETIRQTKAGIPCRFPECKKVSSEGHHKAKKRGNDYGESNRVPLCEEHHRYVEKHPAEAMALGLSASSHRPISQSHADAPSKRGQA